MASSCCVFMFDYCGCAGWFWVGFVVVVASIRFIVWICFIVVGLLRKVGVNSVVISFSFILILLWFYISCRCCVFVYWCVSCVAIAVCWWFDWLLGYVVVC